MATVWYAQATGNVNDVGMWNSASDGSGTTLTWSSLDPTDTLRANGHLDLTINVNTTCAQIDTLNSGGRFVMGDGVTLTADVVAGTASCLVHGVASGAVVGDVYGSATNNNAYGIGGTTGDLTVTGTVTGGGASGSHGIRWTSAGTLTVTGAVTGGSAGSASHGVNLSTGIASIIGNVTGGSTNGVYGVSGTSGTLRVLGDLIAATEPALGISSDSIVHIAGNLYGTAAGVSAIYVRRLALIDGEESYADHAVADATPGTVTGELIRHYGVNMAPDTTVAQFGGRFQRRRS